MIFGRSNKKAAETKRKLIADMLAGKVSIPKKARITGMWIYDRKSNTYRNGAESLSPEDYEKFSAIDDATDAITGMTVDDHNTVFVEDPSRNLLRTIPEPIQAIQTIPEPVIDKAVKPKWWSRKHKDEPALPPAPEPVREPNIWDERVTSSDDIHSFSISDRDKYSGIRNSMLNHFRRNL